MIDEVPLKNVLIGDQALLGLIINGPESAGPRGLISDQRGGPSLVSKLNYGLLHLSDPIRRTPDPPRSVFLGTAVMDISRLTS